MKTRSGQIKNVNWNDCCIRIPSEESAELFQKHEESSQQINKFPSEIHRVYHNKNLSMRSFNDLDASAKQRFSSTKSINSGSSLKRILRSSFSSSPSKIPKVLRFSTSNMSNSSSHHHHKSASDISDSPVVTLSRRETFSSSHRLHNPELSDEQNLKIYSKCNNLNGHGHNYVVYVVLKGPIDKKTGMVYNLADLKWELGEVLNGLDHKNLDLDVEYFKHNISTVENIACYIAKEMKSLMSQPELLYKVKVYETEKNSASVRADDI